MKPEYLRVKGSIGLRRGLGLDEVSLDLTGLPGGLVAITGDNGAGKTTLMDLLHPYRVMPYKLRRAKDYTPGAFAAAGGYYAQFEGRDAEIERIFSVAGQRYRSHILIDSEKRKQEAYLFRDDDGAWVPFNDGVKNGKTRAYDDAVEELCGSPSLFFASVFRAQAARNLSDYTRGEIMGVVAELLGADHIAAQGEKAREVVRALSSVADTLRADVAGLASLESELARVSAETAEAVAKMHEIERFRAHQQEGIDRDSKSLAGLRERVASQSAVQARVADLEAAVAAAKADWVNAAEALRAAQNARKKAGDEIAIRRCHIGTALDDARKILGRAGEVADATARAEALRISLGAQKETLAEAVEALDAARRAQDAYVEADREHTNRAYEATRITTRWETAAEAARMDLLRAREEASKLDALDCAAQGTDWVNESCRFVADAVAARDRIPALETAVAQATEVPPDLERARAELLAASDVLRACGRPASAVAAATKALGEVRGEVRDTERELAAAEKVAVLGSQMDVARATETRLIAELEEADRLYAERTAEIDAQIDERTAARDEVKRRGEALRAQVLEAQAEIDHTLGPQVEALAAAVRVAVDAAASTDQDLTAAQALASRLDGRTEHLEAQLAGGAGIQERLERYDAEIATWKILARACSHDGIVALEIDDAGPGISALANRLLEDCYGPRFSVRFETQRQKTGGGMAEAFDITVFDAEAGTGDSITEKSGGQVTWVEDAICRAIALYRVGTSGREFDAYFSDEKDGALDPGKKQAFVGVKRAALAHGAHTREFFVSQDEGVVAMADGLIRVGGGRVVVEA